MEPLPEPALPLRNERTYGGNAAFHNFHNDYTHIRDPNLRRRLALSEVDKIPFGWYAESPPVLLIRLSRLAMIQG
jgi:PHS family inorganic phosphate transporter-like MFS transporter